MARTFAYLMREEATLDPRSIYQDIDQMMSTTVEGLLAGPTKDRNLLSRAYTTFLSN